MTPTTIPYPLGYIYEYGINYSVQGDNRGSNRVSYVVQQMANAPAFFVAGPADDEDFARAEHLAELLMSSLEGIRCRIIPVLPEKWNDYLERLKAKLGCAGRQPLIWTGSGKTIGGIPEFELMCEVKYGIRIPAEMTMEAFQNIAENNIAALRKKLAAERPGLPTGSSGARGAAVAEALLQGHERYLEGKPGGSPFDGQSVVATVLALSPLSTPPHEVCAPTSAPPFPFALRAQRSPDTSNSSGPTPSIITVASPHLLLPP